MKKIGVISDTHLQEPCERLDRIVSTYFKDVDMIIHAGDMVNLCVLDSLNMLGKEVIAVAGNMDNSQTQKAFPLRRIITVENVRIGIIHGWGGCEGMRSRIRSSFDDIDAIVYGHTHQAYSRREGDVFFFNPGSPMNSRYSNSDSVGILEVTDDQIEGEIINIPKNI